MGNKCCSKRQSDDFAAGYKADVHNPQINKLALDARYTADPHSRSVLGKQPMVDIIRTGVPRRKLMLIPTLNDSLILNQFFLLIMFSTPVKSSTHCSRFIQL